MKVDVEVIGVEELKKILNNLDFDVRDKEFRRVAFNAVEPYRQGYKAAIIGSGHVRRGTLPLTLNRRTDPDGKNKLDVYIGSNNRAPEAVLLAESSRRKSWQSIVPNIAWLDAGADGSGGVGGKPSPYSKGRRERYTAAGKRTGVIKGDRFATTYINSNSGKAQLQLYRSVARFLLDRMR